MTPDMIDLFKHFGQFMAQTAILGALLIGFMRYHGKRQLDRIENSLTKEDIKEMVRKSELEVQMLRLELKMKEEIIATRHDIRNEMQSANLKMQEQLQEISKTLTQLAKEIGNLQGSAIIPSELLQAQQNRGKI